MAHMNDMTDEIARATDALPARKRKPNPTIPTSQGTKYYGNIMVKCVR